MPVLVTLLLLPFQNCSTPKFDTSQLKSYNSGNGDAYEGKLTRYSHNNNSCTEIGANGQPLPDRMIYVFGEYPNIQAQLVRQSCSDLEVPLNIDVAQLQFTGTNGTGNLTYQGISYQPLVAIGDFDVVAAACPAGRAPLASPRRVNLLQASQNLTDPAWMTVDGIGATMTGSLGSMPRYQILRNDPNYTDFWRRLGQVLPLPAGKTYAFSFLAKADSSQWAGFSFYEAMDYTFTLSVNLATGQVRDDGYQGLTARTVSRAFSGGRFITIYFTTPRPASYAAVGVYPSTPTTNDNGQYGDSLFATAIQLEDTDAFCAR